MDNINGAIKLSTIAIVNAVRDFDCEDKINCCDCPFLHNGKCLSLEAHRVIPVLVKDYMNKNI